MKFKVIALLLSFMAISSSVHAGAGHDQHGMNTHHEKSDVEIGKPGKSSKVTRTVMVDMNDEMRFLPNSISVKRGETIKFIVKNSGKIKHEMVLGSPEELKKHAEMMRKMPEMEHDDENQVSVESGKTAELVWEFTKTGKVDFACLQPGHFEAGMKGQLIVKK